MELGAFLAALVGGLLLTEFQAWRPWMCRLLIGLACILTPLRRRERLREEWLAHVNEVPGDIGKIAVALGFPFAGMTLHFHGLARWLLMRLALLRMSPVLYKIIVARADNALHENPDFLAMGEAERQATRRMMRQRLRYAMRCLVLGWALERQVAKAFSATSDASEG